MNNELTATINSTKLPIKEYQGQRVVTLKEIDAVHNRLDGTARKRFNDNKKHFIEGTDFFTITQPSEIRTLGLARPQGGTPESVTLITESGYLMLAKSFTDDLAWTVQRQLVNTYFRATLEQRKAAAKDTAKQSVPKLPALSSVNGAAKMALQAMNEAGVDPAYKVLMLRDFYAPYGLTVPTDGLPETEKTYDLTAMAEILGIMSARSGKPHKNAVGAIVQNVGVMEQEVKIVPFSNNGHSDVTKRYTEPVLDRVRRWLEAAGYPAEIDAPDGTRFKVIYREGHTHGR